MDGVEFSPQLSKAIGDYAVAKTICVLVEHGYSVLEPRADFTRYDLVAEKDGKFCRIQVKYRRKKSGILRVEVKSSSRNPKYYTPTEIEFLAVFCPETDEVYWLPMEEIKGYKEVRLRDTATNRKCRLCKDCGVNRLEDWFNG